MTMRYSLVLAGILSTLCGSAYALSLTEAYEAALQNDPTYRVAVHENEAGREYKALGRASLLPTLSVSYSRNKNRTDITQPNFLGQQTTTHPAYTSSSGQASLRQPLINFEGFARYKQGVAQADYSDAVFSVRSQELVVRVVNAYGDAQFAEEQLRLVQAQRDALAEQKRANDRMFEKGEGTKTDMLETQARFDLAEAQVLEAQDNLTTARNTLAAIIGMDVTGLDPLSDDFRVKPMQPSSFDEWKRIAMEKNPDIAASQYAVQITRQEVNKARAGHAPRLDLIGTYGKSDSDTLSTRNQDATVRSVGMQVVVPLYSGGYVNASIRQARANYERSKADLDSRTKQVMVELRKQYSLALSSAARIEAGMKAVSSASMLVEATRQSIKGGVRVNLDLLNAEQQLYTAKRDLSQSRYNYLLAYLRLRSAAGILGKQDLYDLAGYFVASR
jgi:protease secretion system outer membrane protein